MDQKNQNFQVDKSSSTLSSFMGVDLLKLSEHHHKTSYFEILINSVVFRIVITFLLFSALFATAFIVANQANQKKLEEASRNVVPEAEIKLP